MANKKLILIIEDERALFQVLQKKFENEGFMVSIAVNGEEGLKKAKKEKPSLILLDIVMPKMDGMTMLQKLREDKGWGSKVPVILLTNLGESEKIAEATKRGVHDYLIKTDWKLNDVVKKVREKIGV